MSICGTVCPNTIRQLTSHDVTVGTTSPAIVGADAIRCPHGTVYWITWPLREPSPAARKRPEPSPPLRGRRLINAREDFSWLRSQGESVEDVAARVGIAARTAVEWERLRATDELLKVAS
jgi:hypothetical protein